MFGFSSKRKVLTGKLCEEIYGPWLDAIKLPPSNEVVDIFTLLYKEASSPGPEGNRFQHFISEIVALRFEIYCHVWQMLFWNRYSNLIIQASVTKNIVDQNDAAVVWEKMLKYNRAIPASMPPTKIAGQMMADTTKQLAILQCDPKMAERIVNRSATTALVRNYSVLHRKLAEAFHNDSGWEMSTTACDAIACLAQGFYQSSHAELKNVDPLD